MKFEIHINQNEICINFKKIVNKYDVSINYDFVNEYQLVPSKIFNNSNNKKQHKFNRHSKFKYIWAN